MEWNKLRSVRLQNNHSQQLVANLTGLSIHTIIQAEKNAGKGGYTPNHDTCKKFLHYINTYSNSDKTTSNFCNAHREVLIDAKEQAAKIKEILDNNGIKKHTLTKEFNIHAPLLQKIVTGKDLFVTPKTLSKLNRVIEFYGSYFTKPVQEDTNTTTEVTHVGIHSIEVYPDKIVFKYVN